jgi:hypothetical protein
MSNSLDVTNFPEQGDELVKAVEKHIAGTQRWIVHDLPNEIHITRAQFESMMKAKNGTSYMSAVTNPELKVGAVKKAYIFFTPHNAMDVVIVDDQRKNLPEAGKMVSNDQT